MVGNADHVFINADYRLFLTNERIPAVAIPAIVMTAIPTTNASVALVNPPAVRTEPPAVRIDPPAVNTEPPAVSTDESIRKLERYIYNSSTLGLLLKI
jgi:hypothetical protein